MLLLGIILISYLKTSACLKIVPGKPVPHAAILDDILRRHLGSSFTQNSALDYILGEPYITNDNHSLNNVHDNLDVKTLDIDNLRKIISFVQEKHDQKIQNSRRNQAYEPSNTYITQKATEQTKQSIYFVQDRINATKPYREKYKLHPSYTIAVLYGAASVIVTKMENLLGDMHDLYYKSHFLWYLIIYERLLAANIDVTHIIEKLFAVQGEYIVMRGPKENLPKPDLTDQKTRLPPHVLQQQLIAQQHG